MVLSQFTIPMNTADIKYLNKIINNLIFIFNILILLFYILLSIIKLNLFTSHIKFDIKYVGPKLKKIFIL
jgi:hypothetical protein